MTMIRINLIAERKAGAAKATKATVREKSEIEENAILIGMIFVAVAVVWLRGYLLGQTLEEKQIEMQRLQKEYDNTKHWITREEELLLQKELLNEKIKQIQTLKERREEPVRVLEDVYNAMSPQVWLESIAQGYDKRLTNPSAKGHTAYVPGQSTDGDSWQFILQGHSRSTDAVTHMTDRLAQISSYYHKVDLNNIEKDKDGAYQFKLFFRMKSPQERKASKAQGNGG